MPEAIISKARQVEEILNGNKNVIPNFYRLVVLNSLKEQAPTEFELDAIIELLTSEINKVKKYARG